MTHLTAEQNERLRDAMNRAIKERFRTRRSLAYAMGIQPPSVSDFLNRKSGAALETAELFAQRIAKKPVEQIIGPRKVGTVSRLAPPKPDGFPISDDTRRKATVLLHQPPQKFSDEAIDIGFESVVMRTAAEAANPGAVAELVRIAILGVAATLPTQQPSSSPPAGTRRSRRSASS
jgi:hypothetical protein